MELEAIRQALLCLRKLHLTATDSMAVRSRIRNGWLPDGWHMDDSEAVCSRITFIYILGIAINETANLLASFCKTPVPLQLYSADIKLLVKIDSLKKPHPKLFTSHWKTPSKVLHVRVWDPVPPDGSTTSSSLEVHPLSSKSYLEKCQKKGSALSWILSDSCYSRDLRYDLRFVEPSTPPRLANIVFHLIINYF